MRNLNHTIYDCVYDKILKPTGLPVGFKHSIHRAIAPLDYVTDILIDSSVIYVIAGSITEAYYFSKLHRSVFGHKSRLHYIHDHYQLHGLNIDYIWIYGTAYKNSNYSELISVTSYRNIVLLDGRKLDMTMEVA